MRIQKNTDGYILVLTLIVISALVVIGTQLFYTAGNFSAFANYTYKKEQALWLALGSNAFVQNILFVPAVPKKTDKPQQKEQAGEQQTDDFEQTKKLLAKILPIINRWQTINFTQENDGLDATLSFYVACEDGKIPINSILQTLIPVVRQNQKLTTDLEMFFESLWGDLAKVLRTQQNIGANLAQLIQKRRGVLLNDVTELITIEAFEPLKDYLFVSKNHSSAHQPPLFLSDLFTVHAQYATLDPWVLSASVRAAFGLQAPGEQQWSEKDAEALAARARPTQVWKNDWNSVLKPLYNKEFGQLAQSLKLFLHNGPILHTLSVLSQATVGGVTQRMYFILKRNQLPDKSIVYTPISMYLC